MNQKLKQKTLKSFAGNWSQAIVIALPYLLVFFIGSVPVIPYTILSIFTLVGMSYTFQIWFKSDRTPATPLQSSVTEIFSTPNAFGPFLVALISEIFASLWSLLLVVPGIIKALAYSQAIFIYKDAVENGETNPKFLDCITKSREMMDGHKEELFALKLSFIGWFILAALTGFIGLIWLAPYYCGTMVNYYEELKKYNNEDDSLIEPGYK
ncbi:DUF975 family protein [Fructilactobacillus sp. Tb1]|uniref:DUF975 family protein n=1 Tax=Fructilactobacillus sp. Tb1 TaxID=3422304 RepID=UPI003D289F0E